MRVYFAIPGVGLRSRKGLDDRLRLILGSWSSQIRQARVCVEAANDARGGLDVQCSIEAKLNPSGTVRVEALATDVSTALERAGKGLVVLVKDEFHRAPHRVH